MIIIFFFKKKCRRFGPNSKLFGIAGDLAQIVHNQD
jgi:hypothetical protein